MSDLDATMMPWNTPAARAALVNVPEPYAGLTFETYPRPVPALIAKYAAYDTDKGLVLHGAQGTGKTALAICILRQRACSGFGSMFQWNVLTAPQALCEEGESPAPAPVWFERWSRLLAQNRRERWDEAGWFEQLEDVSVLMLDDIGVDTGTPYRQSLLLRHLEWAEDRAGRRLFLTLNDPPSEWERLLGERVADRLAEARRFLVVHVPGGSLR